MDRDYDPPAASALNQIIRDQVAAVIPVIAELHKRMLGEGYAAGTEQLSMKLLLDMPAEEAVALLNSELQRTTEVIPVEPILASRLLAAGQIVRLNPDTMTYEHILPSKEVVNIATDYLNAAGAAYGFTPEEVFRGQRLSPNDYAPGASGAAPDRTAPPAGVY